MRTPAVFIVLVVTLLASPVASAQTPVPPTGTLMRLTLDGFPPDYVASIGITRTTFDVEGSLRAAAGSGPAIYFVEAGSLSVQAGEDAPVPVVVRAGADAESAMPQDAEPAGEIVLKAGDGFVLPLGATAELRNFGETQAVVLDLLAATDGATEAEAGITHAVLVRREAPLLALSVLVTFDRVTIASGGRLLLPSAPVETVFATVERSQAFLLSGEGINRGAQPMEAYVLAISQGA